MLGDLSRVAFVNKEPLGGKNTRRKAYPAVPHAHLNQLVEGAQLVVRWSKYGAPERIRTSDPQIRSLVLYPAELRARICLFRAGEAGEDRGALPSGACDPARPPLLIGLPAKCKCLR